MYKINLTALLLAITVMISSCSKKEIADPSVVTVPVIAVPVLPAFDINNINDTYADVAPFADYYKWSSYNVHDPSIKKFGDYYYCYSTDVGFGIDVRSGIQIRKSKDLVQWEFVGWVFSNLPPQGSAFIKSNGGTPFNSLWAPYVLLVGSEYRLYYSLTCEKGRLSVIGLATATSPEGPWTERGIAEQSLSDNAVQTNSIDPTVLTTPAGEQYMYYGSAWDGIYIVKLDPVTGLAATRDDRGKRIANRGFTGGKYNGNIEGAEIIYNAAQLKYFLFIAYDWLGTKYNVRVGRSTSPLGPFTDYNGHDINLNEDHIPMILAPYEFTGHQGWQGTAHCTVFDDGKGQFFMAHQGRPVENPSYMDLHVRKMSWTPDGWPVVSPERYANITQTDIAATELVGNWEHIELDYRIVPGYGNEQTSPDLQVATSISLAADGTFSGATTGTYTYAAPLVKLKLSNGRVETVKVERERDWENKIASTIIFTGLNDQGTAIWGKKH